MRREKTDFEISRSYAVFRPLDQYRFLIAFWCEKSRLESVLLYQSRDLGTVFSDRIGFFECERIKYYVNSGHGYQVQRIEEASIGMTKSVSEPA
jgi:hypothetical protein